MIPALGKALYLILLIALAGCVREIPRQGEPTPANTETATPISLATSVPTATPVPASPTPNPPTPTATLTPTSTPLPEPTPTNTPLPIEPPTPTPRPDNSLILDVRGPANGASVQSNGVVVHGTASTWATVAINGKEVELDADGRFQGVVDLASGLNLIEVLAEDTSNGNQLRETILVTSLVLPPQPFFLLVTQPEDQTIITQRAILLAGRTVPGAVVSINGVSVPVDLVGIFATTITLNAGPNIIDVLATNPQGEVLSTIIAVIYRP